MCISSVTNVNFFLCRYHQQKINLLCMLFLYRQHGTVSRPVSGGTAAAWQGEAQLLSVDLIGQLDASDCRRLDADL